MVRNNTGKPKKQTDFSGLGVSPGIGIGFAHIRESGAVDIPEYVVAKSKIEAEVDRLNKAVTKSRRQIARLQSKAKALEGAAAEELGFLLEASDQMLKDSRLIRGAEQGIREHRRNAEFAIQSELLDIARSFAAMDDGYMAARLDDIRDVGNRILRNLADKQHHGLVNIPEGAIIVAEELTPADTAMLDPQKIAGIATVLGGPQGHTAIMARALGIPAVLGAHGLMQDIENGTPLIVDGESGQIVINPAGPLVQKFALRETRRQEQNRKLDRLRKSPAITRDGNQITLEANVELPVEMPMVKHAGAEGIGLLRTEFMFMNRDDIPSEDEQFEQLATIVSACKGKPVTIRTLDIGGEKTAAALMGDFGDSTTSALGLRGIRLSLARTRILETQLKAILRVSKLGPVRILLPMVSRPAEVTRTKEILKRAATKLKRKDKNAVGELPPVGVMIEVPGAALAADAFARVSDFFAIGSNDLTMYTLAIDRGDEQVAHLYDPLHPAVLRLIQFSAQAALRARIPISMCGEMAGDPRFTPLLLGLGIHELSMTASSIPKVKQRIMDLDLSAAIQRAQVIMDQTDSGRIATILDDFNALA